MNENIMPALQEELNNIMLSGFYKTEKIITTAQSAVIGTTTEKNILNFCSNNYLGLSSHPEVIRTGIEILQKCGYGMSSVRFVCGTQKIHKELEQKTAEFLGMEDCILYAAAFDANAGIFEPLMGEGDAIISDELNHASIIDGIRLSKANKYRYRHNDMDDLEEQLKVASVTNRKMIVTDGVFSMDSNIAQLDKICDFAEKYGALVMIDESHATGIVGKSGRGTHEYHDVMERIDIITGTFGKALGGASGGFTASKKEIVALLRQRSRPYLFSNALPPVIAGTSLKVLEMLSADISLKNKLDKNTTCFREKMTQAGFDIIQGNHPIVPVMLYDDKITMEFTARLFKEGIYVTGFSYPIVPRGKARIRVQISAAHEPNHLDHAIKAFVKTGKELNVIHCDEIPVEKKDQKKFRVVNEKNSYSEL